MPVSANIAAVSEEPDREFSTAGRRGRLTPVDGAFLERYAVRRSERVFVLCDCILDIAAAFFNVPSRELRRAGRCADDISRVRQIGMYVTHVVLRFSMAEVGKGFGRDRTTVMHACHTIEDMRDDREFDAVVARLERVVVAALRGREAAGE